MMSLGSNYYIGIKDTDMEWHCSDYYDLIFLVGALSRLKWLDINDIRITYTCIEGDEEDHGYIDPEIVYMHFLEDIN